MFSVFILLICFGLIFGAGYMLGRIPMRRANDNYADELAEQRRQVIKEMARIDRRREAVARAEDDLRRRT